jgi:hypothetical protein
MRSVQREDERHRPTPEELEEFWQRFEERDRRVDEHLRRMREHRLRALALERQLWYRALTR